MGEMFFVGGVLGGAVICASFTAARAASKNRSGLRWFLLGLPFGPLALITVGLMPKLDQPPTPIEESPPA